MTVSGVFGNARSVMDVPAEWSDLRGGRPGDCMFGVVVGQVEIKTSHGHVRILGPDDTFGEMSIVDSSPRGATATATPTRNWR